MTQIRETIHHGSYFNRRTVTVDAMTPASMVETIRTCWYRPPVVTDTMAARMASELETTGRYELGWVTWDVVAPVWALWHGGANYSPSSIHAGELETFPSLADARSALRDRAMRGHWQPQTFTYADGRTVTTLTPCADAGAEMHVYRTRPGLDSDAYPDLVLSWDDESETVTEVEA